MEEISRKIKGCVTKRNLAIFLGILGSSLIVILSFGLPNEIGGCGTQDVATSEDMNKKLSDGEEFK